MRQSLAESSGGDILAAMYPIWFSIGWIDVPSFATLMMLALCAGLALTWMMARRAGLPQIKVLDIALWAVLAGVIGARAGYIMMNWDYFRDHTGEWAYLWGGGLTWHGGCIGGMIGAVIASARRRLDTRPVFDVLTPGLMAGASLGWIGCQLAGVAYGREVFPGDRWWFLAADLPDIYNLWNPRFATQWLGAAWAAVCFVLAISMQFDRRRRTKDQIRHSPSVLRPSSFVICPPSFAITMTLYSAGMFALGFARGDSVPMLGAWRVDQVLDAGITLAGILYILWSLSTSLIVQEQPR